MTRLLVFTTFFLVCSTVTDIGYSADVSIEEGQLGHFVFIHGDIEPGDFEQIERASEFLVTNLNTPLRLVLNSAGGDVVESIRIGRFARNLLASVVIDGNTLYTPNTPKGDIIEKNLGDSPFTYERQRLRPITRNQPIEPELSRCFSACVLVFYGAVVRYASDNNDLTRAYNVKDGGQEIPTIGIHRPYIDPDTYANYSAVEAKAIYADLEMMVRTYLTEMGAPYSIADRMFRKASNEVELLISTDFEAYFHRKEPFLDEWLISKCGDTGPEQAFNRNDYEYYTEYSAQWKIDLYAGRIPLNGALKYVPSGFSTERIWNLNAALENHNEKVKQCNYSTLLEHQIEQF